MRHRILIKPLDAVERRLSSRRVFALMQSHAAKAGMCVRIIRIGRRAPEPYTRLGIFPLSQPQPLENRRFE